VSERRPRPALYLGLACALLFALNANANLLTNGSFEDGSFVNQGSETMVLTLGSTVMSGWTVSNDQLAWIDTGNPWGLSAQDGNRFLDLTSYSAGAPFGGVTQTVATTPGDMYSLSFYLGSYTASWGGPPMSITAAAAGTSQTFTVSTTSTSSTWTPFSMQFTANSATTAVSLTGAAGFNYIGLDNVNLDDLGGGGGSVPEPATYALIPAGLGLLALARRRRR
jgi:hypothetical protein